MDDKKQEKCRRGAFAFTQVAVTRVLLFWSFVGLG